MANFPFLPLGFIVVFVSLLAPHHSAQAASKSTTIDFSDKTQSGYMETYDMFLLGFSSEYPKLEMAYKRGAFPVDPTISGLTVKNPNIDAFNRRIVAVADIRSFVAQTQSDQIAYIAHGQTCIFAFRVTGVGTLSIPSYVDTDSNEITIDPGLVCAPGMVLATDRYVHIIVRPNDVNGAGTIDSARFYVYTGDSSLANNPAGTDVSSAYTVAPDLGPMMNAAGISIHGGTPVTFDYLNDDTRPELLVASSTGQTNKLVAFWSEGGSRDNNPYTFLSWDVLIDDMGFTPPFASASKPPAPGPSCADTATITSRGVTAIDAGDINNDGVTDLVAGSLSESNIHAFVRTSMMNYSRTPDIVPGGVGGILRLEVQDFDGDGISDILVVRSGTDCGGLPAQVILLINDGQGNFAPSSQVAPAAFNSSIDWAVAHGMTVRPAKNDPTPIDQQWDIMLGKTTGTSPYAYWWNAAKPPLHPVVSHASSRSTGNLLNKSVGSLQAIASVQFSVTQAPTSGTTGINWKISPDQGLHVDPMLPAEVKASGSTVHYFTTFDRLMRFYANFSATTTTPASQPYGLASTGTPSVSGLTLNYTYFDTVTTSRSAPAYGLQSGNNGFENVYSLSFDIPKYQLTLTATKVASAFTSGSKASPVGGVNPDFQQSRKMDAMLASSRNVFYASPSASVVTVNNMLSQPVTSSVLPRSASGLTAKLFRQMNIPSGGDSPAVYLAQFRSGAAGETDYLNPTCTLRGAGHSSPLYVGPPSGNATLMGSGYAAFATSQAARAPMILLAANDGMVHAFDAKTGVENWAHIPANLMDKLARLFTRSGDVTGPSGGITERFPELVDGPVMSADVQDAQNNWYTIALVGQGQGTTTKQTNYYHAIDISDPARPKALWEFTETLGDGSGTCSPYNYTTTCVPSTSSCNETTGCVSENSLGMAEMLVSASSNALEAETYDAIIGGSSPASGTWSKATAAAASAGAYMAASASRNCAAGSLYALQSCPKLTYRLSVASSAAGSYYPAFRVFGSASSTAIAYSIDQIGFFQPSPAVSSTDWIWAMGPATSLSAGNHELTVYMVSKTATLDGLKLQKSATAPTGKITSTTPAKLCNRRCTPSKCTTKAVAKTEAQKAASCPSDVPRTCCVNPVDTTVGYCAPAGTCSGLPAASGQTFSTPAVGRIKTPQGDRWAAFFGSGFDDGGAMPRKIGQSLYIVEAYTGKPIASFSVPDYPTTQTSQSGKGAVIAGGPVLVDVDSDGYVDRAYFGDYTGRLWRLDTSGSTPSNYPLNVLFDASNPYNKGSVYAPISFTPSAAVLVDGMPNVYFGTGGDPTGSTSPQYVFYSVRDTNLSGTSAGNVHARTGLVPDAKLGEWTLVETTSGGKFYGPASIVNDSVIYFSSTTGNTLYHPSVATINSKLYGIAIRTFTSLSPPKVYNSGDSVLQAPTTGTSTSFLTYNGIPAPLAPPVGAGVQVPGVVTGSSVLKTGAAQSNVFIQTAANTVQSLVTPGVLGQKTGGRRIHWREVNAN